MSIHPPRWILALALVLASACAHGPTPQAPGSSPLEHLTKEQRLDDIKRAGVWTATDIPAMDLRAGPQGHGAFAPFATVNCNYLDRKMGGSSPKFTCELAPGDEVKVKYGASNVEVYGEVAASRLLWALGFGADRWYPVTVICHGCPSDPHHNATATNVDVTFDIAAIERKMPGKTLETHPDEGWKWPELLLLADDASSAGSKAQRDALTLLAVMLQHTDSKAEQQRIVCKQGAGDASDDGRCAAPFMFVHDVGLTFGKANAFNRNSVSGVNFANWSTQSVWRNRRQCVGELGRSIGGTLGDPVIGEAGRQLLASLLVQLSDAQLRDLFEVARFPDFSHITVDRWIAAFKTKRDEIVNNTCPG